MLLHPEDELLQERLGLLLVPNKVVVNDENGAEPCSAHII